MPPDQLTPNGYEFLSHNSQPKKRSVVTIILLSFFVLLSLGLTVFGFWAFAERQEYKNKSDQKAAKAVELAKEQFAQEKEKEFAEREKNPHKEYKGPATYGSVDIVYPKSWSAFVTETPRGSTPIDGYFHPDVVPGIDSGTSFALRLEVTGRAYDEELRQYESQAKSGKVKVSPYKVPKVADTLGARVEGEIGNGAKGIVVLFPVRDKTLKISTEAEQFRGDFDNIIMANLTFVP